MNVKDVLLYPIRYLLRHRVKEYKGKLKRIKDCEPYVAARSRRNGMTNSVFYFVMKDSFLAQKYTKFIDKWSL